MTQTLLYRPEKPLEFIVQYLDEICDGANPLVHSYHMLQLTHRNPARRGRVRRIRLARADLEGSRAPRRSNSSTSSARPTRRSRPGAARPSPWARTCRG